MKACIFDFDGVIVDSETYWPDATFKALQELIPSLTKEASNTTRGKSAYDIHAWLKNEYGLQMELEEFLESLNDMVADVYAQSALLPGCKEFIEQVQQCTPHLAIGTSSKRKWVLPVMERLDLLQYFKTIVTASDVPVGQSKPQPTIFLEAAKQMNIDPADCMVIEDSTNGVKAAKAAGMYTIGLQHVDDTQNIAGADLIVQHFSQIPLATLF